MKCNHKLTLMITVVLTSVTALQAEESPSISKGKEDAQPCLEPVFEDHLRIVSLNLEFFNDRASKTNGAEPDGTAAQLDALAQRMKGFDAAIFALQEIDQIEALNDLRIRMGDTWQVFAGNVLGVFPQQNAILYDTSKVDLISAAFVRTNPDTRFSPTLYPTWIYRCPVTGVFCPKGCSDETFRIIGIHCHYKDAELRRVEGYWLSNYVSHLLSQSVETPRVILPGDFNGTAPAAPHDGIVSGGNLSPVAKRNGELTTVYPDLMLDHIYVAEAARKKLSVPTAFVVRPEHFAETGLQFEAAHSDHLPVLIDYAIK